MKTYRVKKIKNRYLDIKDNGSGRVRIIKRGKVAIKVQDIITNEIYFIGKSQIIEEGGI